MINNGESVTGPDPWVQYIDPVTGKTYYENQYVSIEDPIMSTPLIFISGLTFGIVIGIFLHKYLFCKK